MNVPYSLAELAERSQQLRRPVSLVLLSCDAVAADASDDGPQRLLAEVAAAIGQHFGAASRVLQHRAGCPLLVAVEDAGYEATGRVSERVRAKFDKGRGQAASGAGSTASIGVAEYCAPESVAEWLRRTQLAHHAASVSGGNRVVVDRHSLLGSLASRPARPGAALEWSEAFACGHAQIDAEHRALIEDAREVIQLAGTDSPQLLGRLQPLLESFAAHCAAEDAVLREIGFPGREQHHREHLALLAKAGRLLARARAGDLAAQEIGHYLAHDVIARHMLLADRDYVAWLPQPHAD